jgi:hypothetical protein
LTALRTLRQPMILRRFCGRLLLVCSLKTPITYYSKKSAGGKRAT